MLWVRGVKVGLAIGKGVEVGCAVRQVKRQHGADLWPSLVFSMTGNIDNLFTTHAPMRLMRRLSSVRASVSPMCAWRW